ncbi:FG-GAP-like repeat-containing protein [Methylotetracoccus oryzae]|uniref:FG-GAP-like repeat-containing protein n=1 Tax=Methylotetracoccus oryzae TaxID=1919059 RepID=UPI00111AE444|nr:FG-GAP-like repeat-containing protein [Methylotetracoccus oryzae]
MKRLSFASAWVYLTFILCVASQLSATAFAFTAPVLKWSRGGCYDTWCETAWYSSPALVDVDRDGILDVVASAYSLFALNGANGNLIWRVGDTSRRTWPGIVVADIDQAGGAEIITAQSGGYLTVYNLAGQTKWQRQPTTGELRGVLAADLDGNGGKLELTVTAAVSAKTNTWVYNSNGILRTGWPQLNNENGYAWGVFNANAAAGNLDSSDTRLEIVVPSDVHYINAYKPNGVPLRVSNSTYPGKTYWGKVGVWENLSIEKRGFGDCDGTRAESYLANFATGPAVIADLNGDGVREVAVTGNMYNCQIGYPPSQYTALFIFNKNRTRFNSSGYDWRTIPINTGTPLAEDYNLIESAMSNPAVADLDGDGKKEILFASYDGRMHAYWLDKTQHGSWPYSIYKSSEGFIRFASEPTIADLDSDGKSEVIFASWVQKGTFHTGKLHILSADGQPIYEVDLPDAVDGNWNGVMAAPTLGNIDADADLEVVLNTMASGIVVYDLPGTAHAVVRWGTGRGNFLRNGAL